MLTWTYSTIAVSFLFVQNTFNYNPADAERFIVDKLDIESKSWSFNMTARYVSYYLDREWSLRAASN